MNKKLRILLICVAVLIVLLLVAPFLIPVNQFRPTLEQRASAVLGRQVQIGNISLSLLGGSLSAENLSIADDPKFSNSAFLTAKSVKVGVELMPLIFSKTLNVTGINIENPEVTLLKNPAGDWNYSSLGGSKSSAPATQSSSASKSGSSSSSGTPEISIAKLALSDGKIILGTTNSNKRATYDKVNITATDFSPTKKFPITLSASLPGGGDLKLEGNVGPIDQADSSLTPLDAKVKVDSMNLSTTGFLDPSLGLGGLVDMDTTLNSQGGVANTKGSIKLSKALLVQGGSPASVPAVVDYSTRYDLKRNSGVINPSTVKIGNATAKVNGTYTSQGEDTVVNVKLVGDSMPASDLQSFLPAIGVNLPKGASLQGGTLSANLDIKGPTNKLVTDGTLGLFNGKLAGFDLGSKMSAVSALTGLKTGSDLVIEKLTTNVHMAPTGLRADNFDAVIPSLGTLVGGGTLDSKNNLDFKMAATLTGGAIGALGSGSSAAGGLLGAALGGGKSSNCKGGTTIPFLIQGTASDPKFLPDVSGLAAGMLKSQLGCVGGSVLSGGQNTGGKPADAINNALGGLFKKKKP